jgi:hypothetical protein
MMHMHRLHTSEPGGTLGPDEVLDPHVHGHNEVVEACRTTDQEAEQSGEGVASR